MDIAIAVLKDPVIIAVTVLMFFGLPILVVFGNYVNHRSDHELRMWSLEKEKELYDFRR